MLLNFGFNIEIHSKVERETYPDFKVFKEEKPIFLLEATIVMPGKKEKSAEAVENCIYDTLNKKVHSPDFFIGIEIAKKPKNSFPTPSAQKISKFLNQKLQYLNYDELVQKLKQDGIESIPRWRWSDKGWEIIFFPIPKSPEMRGKSGVRPIGIFVSQVFLSQTDKKSEKILKTKLQSMER